MTIEQINALPRSEFVRVIGPVFEHSPWIAERTPGPFADVADLHAKLVATTAGATDDEKLSLIRAHPDLVGRLAREGKLTRESTGEQAAAGLASLSEDEANQFETYNAVYRDKFGFPFVICARENKKDAILAAFPVRLKNNATQERHAALNEIYKIARLRLLDLVKQMPFKLTHNAYGKSAVRLTKVVRRGQHHTLFEIDAAVQLEGDFAAAYTAGDNRQVVATDTIKNTVYVVAKENAFDSIEQFAVLLCRHFINTYAHVSAVTVELSQATWDRIAVEGRPHDHAFSGGGSHTRVCTATLGRNIATPNLTGGIDGLLVLKTTQSGWEDFHTDRYRTLKDTNDRILASKVNARWTFNTLETDANAAYDAILAAVLTAFATTYSPGAQKTIQDMGEAALTACAAIDSIQFTLPNLHRIPFNLQPFGLAFDNDIYVATDEPHGLIHGTVTRA